MPDIDWPAPTEAQRRAAVTRKIQQWVEHVLPVPQERTLNLGCNGWRFYFHKDGQALHIPLYEDPLDDGLWAVLPEDIDDVQITYRVRAR